MGYRKKVVYENLRNSFPEKTEQEIDAIAKKFFRFLGDVTLEGIKALSMTEAEVKERMTVETCPEFEASVQNNRNAIMVIGHYGNWEYVNLRFALLENRQLFVGVYKELSNKALNDYLYNTRGRFDTQLAEMREVSKKVASYAKAGTPISIGLVSDQSPSKERGYWMRFLNQDTPVFLGADRYANRLNAQVFFVEISSKKRGYYHMNITPSVMEPKELKQGEITEIHTKRLEQIIQEKPELWVWSHKRWKHKRPEGLPSEQISTRYPGKV